MNTEINFLEKEPNKNRAYIVLGIIFFILLTLTVTLLLLQQSSYDKQLITLENERVEVETVLMEQQAEHGTVRQLERVQEEMRKKEAEMIPNTALYREITGLLGTAEQLISYGYETDNGIVVDATFQSLNAIAEYIAALMKESYVEDVLLTSSVKMGQAYEATFELTIDSEMVMEEFAAND
ncbi:hypothetical protein [Oceanobacillus damuensis]|uniref:hypothetical protein n=1 Tax=Oceanobacillus damuensis TaxID=937928 RepID=UPI0008336816|nr:hypothetical protein [Oceanobacillus damuensis]